MSPVLLGRVFAELLRRHDALRMRYRQQVEGHWEQFDSGGEALQPWPLQWVELSGMSAAQQERVQALVVAQAQQSLDLEAGAALRAPDLVRGGGGRAGLLVGCLHLARGT